MHTRPDGFFLFLKTSYILDIGLIFKLNYRPAKPFFTGEIFHVLLVDTMPCSAESLSSGKAALSGSLAHAHFFLPQALPWGFMNSSQPAPETQSYVAWQSALKCSLRGCCADSLNSHTPLLIYIFSLCWDLWACSQIFPEMSPFVTPPSPTEFMWGTFSFWCITK